MSPWNEPVITYVVRKADGSASDTMDTDHPMIVANRLGSHGWELVSQLTDPYVFFDPHLQTNRSSWAAMSMLFKRPLEEVEK